MIFNFINFSQSGILNNILSLALQYFLYLCYKLLILYIVNNK